MKTTVSEKGQVTIPKKLRDRLGIRPGAVLEFEEDNGRMVVTKMLVDDAVSAVSGILADQGIGTDDFIDSIRGQILPGDLTGMPGQ